MNATLHAEEAAAWARYKYYVKLRIKQTPGGEQVPRPDAEMSRLYWTWRRLYCAIWWH